VRVESGQPESQTADSAEFQQSRFYGVKSYLHQFYQSPTTEDPEGAWYLLPPATPNRCALYLCRAVSILGLILLLAGAALLVIAYGWPRKTFDDALEQIDVSFDDNGNIYLTKDRLQDLYHILRDDPFHWCKLVGLSLFASGGVLLAFSLLIPTCVHCYGQRGWSDIDSPSEPPVRVFTSADRTSQPGSPVEKVSCDVSKVQPGSDESNEKRGADSVLLSEGEKQILK